MTHNSHPPSRIPELPEDVVLAARHVSKKFCRNLKRSMYYGMVDLARNLLGIRTGGDYGRRTTDNGRRTTDDGLRTTDNGRRTTDDGLRTTDYGRRTTDDGLRTTDNGLRTTDNGLRTADRSGRTPNQEPPTNAQVPSTEHQELPSPLRKDEFWAIRDVSFDLHRGERLGIIGMNGSGKSTLLRILSGIFPPDDGIVAARGRVNGLIALGSGMHPHMTGRENIYLNGAILGMSRREMDQKFEAIAEFSELGEFLDAPLSSYSSGMKVKLGFAVAIHGEPDILLIDEVLAIGDYAFVNKSLRQLYEYHRRAKALVYISHNLEQVRNLCSRVLVLDRGGIVYDGEANRAVAFYEDLCVGAAAGRARTGSREGSGRVVWATEAMEVKAFDVVDGDGAAVDAVAADGPLRLKCRLLLNEGPRRLYFSIGIHDEKRNVVIWMMSNDFRKNDFGPMGPGEYELHVHVPEHHLMPGVYFAAMSIRDDDSMETLSRLTTESVFGVRGGEHVMGRGLVRVDEKWNLRRV